MITVEELLVADRRRLMELLRGGHPIDPESLDDTVYEGIALGLGRIVERLTWKKFAKTFCRDGGHLRGWNVRLQQTGWTDPGVPMLDRKGDALTFGHYHVLPAAGRRFGKGWSGGDYLDYGVAGNTLLDVARFTYAPLVTVPGGNGDLLLGWEVFKLGPLRLPLPLYWALQYEGTLDAALPPPRG